MPECFIKDGCHSIFGENKTLSYTRALLQPKQNSQCQNHSRAAGIRNEAQTSLRGNLLRGPSRSSRVLIGKVLETLFEFKLMFQVNSDTTEQIVTVFCKTLIN